MLDFYYLFEQLVCSDHEVAGLLERREKRREKEHRLSFWDDRKRGRRQKPQAENKLPGDAEPRRGRGQLSAFEGLHCWGPISIYVITAR